MAKNIYKAGPPVQVIAPSAVTAGTGFLLGQLFLIPIHSAASGARVECYAECEIEIAKTSALTITAGDTLYWDDANKVVNKTSSGAKEVGFATGDAANPSSTVRAMIRPEPRTSVAS